MLPAYITAKYPTCRLLAAAQKYTTLALPLSFGQSAGKPRLTPESTTSASPVAEFPQPVLPRRFFRSPLASPRAEDSPNLSQHLRASRLAGTTWDGHAPSRILHSGTSSTLLSHHRQIRCPPPLCDDQQRTNPPLRPSAIQLGCRALPYCTRDDRSLLDHCPITTSLGLQTPITRSSLRNSGPSRGIQPAAGCGASVAGAALDVDQSGQLGARNLGFLVVGRILDVWILSGRRILDVRLVASIGQGISQVCLCGRLVLDSGVLLR